MDDLLKPKEQLVEELQRTLEQVEQAKQEWEITADSLSELVCLLDDQGRIIRANRVVERWQLGSVTDIKGREIQELFDPAWADFWGQAWTELAQGRPAEREVEDGRLERYLHVRVQPIMAQTSWHSRVETSSAVVVIRDVTVRVQAEKALQRRTAQLEWLVRDTYHRVKNNLMVIESLLRFQAAYIEDAQVLDMFKESQTRIKSMLLIHEKLHQSEDLTRVDFAGYIQKLVVDLFRTYKPPAAAVELLVNIGDVFLDADTATSCGLIINELISNALKHAFPGGRGGELRIELRPENGRFVLIVSDNGVGFPEGVDFQDTDSLGMQIVIMKTEDLDGTIELHRNGGTTFKITFAGRDQEEEG